MITLFHCIEYTHISVHFEGLLSRLTFLYIIVFGFEDCGVLPLHHHHVSQERVWEQQSLAQRGGLFQTKLLLVEALDLSWVHTWCKPPLTTSNTQRLHSTVPLHSKCDEVDLKYKKEINVIDIIKIIFPFEPLIITRVYLYYVCTMHATLKNKTNKTIINPFDTTN